MNAEAKTKVLVVDDDRLIREALKDILESDGYRVATAEDGEEALERYISELDFGLIIADINMPKMSGIELLRELRGASQDVPIIILTSDGSVSAAIEALKAGASDYILKEDDFSNAVLFATARAIEKNRLMKQNLQLTADLAIKNNELEDFNRTLENIIKRLTNIGTSLNSEKNLGKLLELIVTEVGDVTHADGVTIYMLEDGQLHFRIARNRSLKSLMGGAGAPVTFPPVPLVESNVSAYCALRKEIINIPDVYEYDGFNFTGPRKFDEATGYRTKSMLVLPMTDRNENVIGVLQLVNCIAPATGEVVRFSGRLAGIAHSVACQAGVCIENARSYEKIERKNTAFERFVPTEFLRYLGKTEVEDIKLGDAAVEDLSVLFSDIRSFTTMSEKMTAEENFRFLNSYLKVIGPVISANGGFIDKYIGDAIMALFHGARSAMADDAVGAAIGMLEKLEEYNVNRGKSGYSPVRIGIGINTGPLTLGTIGFERRMDSTVIGDTVNLASRIEGLTKLYGIGIAIASHTFDRLKDPSKYLVREIDTVKVKGKKAAVTFYEVFSGDPEPQREAKAKTLAKYNEALSLYKERRFSEAARIFCELGKSLPSDEVIRIYAERCEFTVKGVAPAHSPSASQE